MATSWPLGWGRPGHGPSRDTHQEVGHVQGTVGEENGADIGTYCSARVSNAALLGAIPPLLLKTDDNPEGVEQSVFDGIKAAVVTDRSAYFKDFLDDLADVDELGGRRTSEQALKGGSRNIAWTPPNEVYTALLEFIEG